MKESFVSFGFQSLGQFSESKMNVEVENSVLCQSFLHTVFLYTVIIGLKVKNGYWLWRDADGFGLKERRKKKYQEQVVWLVSREFCELRNLSNTGQDGLRR